MQQIVMNLVINAAEAIGADQSGTVTIATRAQEVSGTDRILDEVTAHPLAPGSYVCFEVADTGCGMDGETRKKIFDPFFTTKFIGRGLGLAALAGIGSTAWRRHRSRDRRRVRAPRFASSSRRGGSRSSEA